MTISHKSMILQLYKNILFSAKRFPSIKRNNIINEIKIGFRQYKDNTDQQIINQQIHIAQDGLTKLSMYSTLKNNSNSWSVNMDSQPMPRSSS